MSWAVHEESVDCYSIGIEILAVSSHPTLVRGKLTPKVVRAACLVELDPGGSSLSVTKNTLLFPFIRDPLPSVTFQQWQDDSRITKDEIASNKYFSDVQSLVLVAWRECLAQYRRLCRLRIFLAIILKVLAIRGLHQFDDLLDFLCIDRL
jgi:hypothetical protein